jgi:hypothetical protein
VCVVEELLIANLCSAGYISARVARPALGPQESKRWLTVEKRNDEIFVPLLQKVNGEKVEEKEGKNVHTGSGRKSQQKTS